MKLNYRIIILVLLFGLFSNKCLFSQCLSATNFGSITVVYATCDANGRITIDNMIPNMPSVGVYEYKLVNPLNANLNRTWQTNNVFDLLVPGDYQLFSRTLCASSNYSSEIIYN